MWWILLFQFFVIWFVVGVVQCTVEKKTRYVVAYALLALIVSSITVFYVAPVELGVSRAPSGAEEFTRRLKEGNVYYVIATDDVVHGTTNSDKIVLVREAGTSSYFTIRVNISTPIPEQFTLINGLPREVK